MRGGGLLLRSSLVDAADFIPYMPNLLPGIKDLLVDPVPEVRKIVAVALGVMVSKVRPLIMTPATPPSGQPCAHTAGFG